MPRIFTTTFAAETAVSWENLSSTLLFNNPFVSARPTLPANRPATTVGAREVGNRSPLTGLRWDGTHIVSSTSRTPAWAQCNLAEYEPQAHTQHTTHRMRGHMHQFKTHREPQEKRRIEKTMFGKHGNRTSLYHEVCAGTNISSKHSVSTKTKRG